MHSFVYYIFKNTQKVNILDIICKIFSDKPFELSLSTWYFINTVILRLWQTDPQLGEKSPTLNSPCDARRKRFFTFFRQTDENVF